MADTGGLQWFQLKPPLKIARTPNLLTSRRVIDKIAMCVIEGLSTGEKLHNLAFKSLVQQVATFFFFFFFFSFFFFWSLTYS